MIFAGVVMHIINWIWKTEEQNLTECKKVSPATEARPLISYLSGDVLQSMLRTYNATSKRLTSSNRIHFCWDLSIFLLICSVASVNMLPSDWQHFSFRCCKLSVHVSLMQENKWPIFVLKCNVCSMYRKKWHSMSVKCYLFLSNCKSWWLYTMGNYLQAPR